MAVAVVNRYKDIRYSLFKWRYEASLVYKIILVLGIACFTGLAAQVRVPLPWTPVPITLQTFAVLLSGILLGRWYGGLSQAFYVGAGAAGLRWFAGWNGGVSYLLGPTGGYLIGFILAALFLGHFVDKYIRARSFFPILALMLFANFILVYLPGLLQLSLVTGVRNIYKLLMMGAVPFISGDIIKLIAAALAKTITPKKAYIFLEKLAGSIATEIYTFVSRKSLGKIPTVTYITHIDPLSFRLRYVLSPMIMWSRTSIAIVFPTSTIC